MGQQKAHMGMEGRFTDIWAHQEDDDGNVIAGTQRQIAGENELETRDGFENLITNNGLDLLKSTGFLKKCFVGSGSTAPANGDTKLDAKVGPALSRDSGPNEGPSDLNPASGDPYCSATCTYKSGKGDNAGNLSEIAIGKGDNNLFSRALIKDSGGSPTTITISNIEFLTVTYEWRVYFDLDYEVTDTFQTDNETYTCKSKLGYIYSKMAVQWESEGWVFSNGNGGGITVFTGDVGDAGSSPNGTEYGIGESTSNVTHGASGTYTTTYSAHLGVNDANDTIKSAESNPYSRNQTDFGPTTKCSIDPPIQKDNTMEIDLSITTEWGRYTP